MKYKFLVLDIDGTLTNSKKEITPNTKKRLIELQQSGVMVVLASGRPTYGITPLAEELEMDKFGGYILSFNGGKIINAKSEEVIFQTPLSAELVPMLYQKAVGSGAQILSYKDRFIVSEEADNKYVQYESFLTKMEVRKADSFVETMNFAPDKCLIVGEPATMIKLGEGLNEEYAGQLCAYRSEEFYLEVVPPGIDKAKSLERLLRYVGATKEEMIAVGDGYNDLSMIEFAGVGVAMANGAEEVKSAADYVTLSNEEDGVVAVIDKFFV